MKIKKKSVIAVIGGGRWGRVTLSVLAEIKNIPFDEILIISKNNTIVNEKLIDVLNNGGKVVNLVATLEQAFLNYIIKAAIVVNNARMHFDTASYLLDQGVHILVEKPVTLCLSDAKRLMEKSKQKGLCFVPGLNYRFCSYLDKFREKLEAYGQKPVRFLVEWFDAAGEIRYGEYKNFDRSINLAQDIMPHIWTLISTVFKPKEVDITWCEFGPFKSTVDYVVMLNDLPGRIRLARDGLERRRKITVWFNGASNSENIILDFTKEPGIIILNGIESSADSVWKIKRTPLRQQIDYFLSLIKIGMTPEVDLDACLQSVQFTEIASSYFEQSQSMIGNERLL